MSARVTVVDLGLGNLGSVMQALHDGVRRFCRRDQPVPHLVIDRRQVQLGQRRHVGQDVQSFRRRDRERPQASTLDMRQ